MNEQARYRRLDDDKRRERIAALSLVGWYRLPERIVAKRDEWCPLCEQARLKEEAKRVSAH